MTVLPDDLAEGLEIDQALLLRDGIAPPLLTQHLRIHTPLPVRYDMYMAAYMYGVYLTGRAYLIRTRDGVAHPLECNPAVSVSGHPSL